MFRIQRIWNKDPEFAENLWSPGTYFRFYVVLVENQLKKHLIAKTLTCGAERCCPLHVCVGGSRLDRLEEVWSDWLLQLNLNKTLPKLIIILLISRLIISIHFCSWRSNLLFWGSSVSLQLIRSSVSLGLCSNCRPNKKDTKQQQCWVVVLSFSLASLCVWRCEINFDSSTEPITRSFFPHYPRCFAVASPLTVLFPVSRLRGRVQLDQNQPLGLLKETFQKFIFTNV